MIGYAGRDCYETACGRGVSVLVIGVPGRLRRALPVCGVFGSLNHRHLKQICQRFGCFKLLFDQRRRCGVRYGPRGSPSTDIGAHL